MTEENEVVSQTALQLEVERLRAENEEYKDKYLRAIAESENARKRLSRERQESLKHVVGDLLCDFLKPIDQFEMALGHAEKGSSEIQNWALGFQMILTQLKETLSKHGVTPFDSQGRLFDPHFHEAVEAIETDDCVEGTILKELARGYLIGDRTLRPAHVVVAKKLQTSLGEKTDE